MNRGNVDITISGAVSRAGAKPVTVAWRVSIGPIDTPKTIEDALAEACGSLHATLKKELLP